MGAEKAIADLASTGISKERLGYIVFDGSYSKSQVEAAASKLPSGTLLDGIVMNAGGVGHDTEGKPTEPNNILPIVQINLAAHVHLVEYLLKQKNLQKNARIIYIGTEGSRGIPFMGMKAPDFSGDTPEFFKSYIDGSAYSNKYDPMEVYPDAKGIATLYFAAWARAHPDLFVLTVSPGGTKGTSFASQEAVNPIMGAILPVMMTVMSALGKMHALDVGAKRYVDAVTGEGEFKVFTKSGAFVASKSGVAGPVADQTEVFASGKQYADVGKQDAVFVAMNEFL